MLEIRKSTTGEAFDLNEGAELRTSKALDRIDELGRITQQAALSLSLPATPRNRQLLARADANALNPAEPYRIAVDVRQGGQAQEITALNLLSFSQAEGYEAEPYGEDWVEDLAALPLNEINLGLYEWTQENIERTWQQPRGDVSVLPGLADYGTWFEPGSARMADLRLWLSVRDLLRAALRQVGWSFTCPHLDDGDGRTWYAYLGGDRWHYYPSKVQTGYVELTAAAGQAIESRTEKYPAWSEVVDEADQWNRGIFDSETPGYRYQMPEGSSTARFQVEVDALLSVEAVPARSGQAAPALVVSVVESVTQPDGEIRTEVLGEYIYPVPVGVRSYTQAVAIDHTVIRPNVLGIVRLEFDYTGIPAGHNATITINSARLVLRPDPPYYGRGDLIEVGAGLDSKLTALDVLTAVGHLVNGKFSTDLARREVRLDVPFSYQRTNYPSETVPGFYLRDTAPLDLREQTAPGSLRWRRIEQDKQARYVEYDLSGDNDEAVRDSDRARWRRRVDRGRGDKTQTDERENQLFEPTRTVPVSAGNVGGQGLDLPALWDNTEGRRSVDVGPRVLNYYGLQNPESGSGWLFEGQPRLTFPMLSQATGPRTNAGLATEPVVFSGFANDLFERFYRREVQARAVTLEILLHGGDATYNAIDFRRLILIRTEEGELEIQPTAVRDHARGSSVALPVEGYSIHNSY